MQYEVVCDICGKTWLEQDPGVRFLGSDGVWECSDEAMCFTRKAMTDLERSVDQ